MLVGTVPFKADTQVGVAMKHVKEPLPDVASRAGGLGAVASIVDRATAKQVETATRRSTRCSRTRVRLAIEVARTGEATSEATNVLQALPGDTADFVPLRLRRPKRALLLTLLLIAAAIVWSSCWRPAPRRHEGRRRARPPTKLTSVSLSNVGVVDPRQAIARSTIRASSRDRRKPFDFWTTENYDAASSESRRGMYVQRLTRCGKSAAAREPVRGDRRGVRGELSITVLTLTW